MKIIPIKAKTKNEYTQMMKDICPSKDIRALAKQLSKRKIPCRKCVYPVGSMCMFPYSDLRIEDWNLDPCYEGVLRT